MREDTTCLEVVEETSSLTVALRALATHVHPSLPSMVEQDRVGDCLVVREETGPGRPVAGTEPWSAARAAAAGAGLCEGLEALRRHTQGRLPVRVTPEDLWVTRAGVLRLRKLGLAQWGEEPEPASVMQGLFQAVHALTRPEERDRLVWVQARCATGDPGRCYGSFPELGDALRRVAGEGHVDGLRLPTSRSLLPRPAGAEPRRRGSWRPAMVAVLLLALLGAWMAPADLPPPQEALAVVRGPRVTLLSLATGEPLMSWELPETPRDLAVTPDGRWIFAALEKAGSLAVLEPFRARDPWYVRLAGAPHSVLIDERGDRLFVTHPDLGLVTVVAVTPRGASCCGVLAVPVGPIELATRHGLLYCSDGRNVKLFGLDPMQRLAERRLPGAGSLGLSVGGRFLYVADRLRPRVHVLDASRLERLGHVTLLRVADRLIPVGSEVWAAEPGLLQPVSLDAPWIPLPAGVTDFAPARELVWFLGTGATAADPALGRCVAWLQLSPGTSRIAFVPARRRR